MRTPAVFLLSSSLLLTGCFAGAGAETSTTAEGNGRIKLAQMLPPRSALSPFSDDAFKLSRWSTAETLIKLDELGDAQPALATSWKRSSPLTWEFTIRPGVKFHDGTVLTADGAAFALTRATIASPKPRILDGVKLTAVAKGNTVLVSTAEADPLVPQRLSSPQLSILAKAAYSGKRVNPVGTGTGPFKLVEVRGTSGARLDRYDGYWGEKAQARRYRRLLRTGRRRKSCRDPEWRGPPGRGDPGLPGGLAGAEDHHRGTDAPDEHPLPQHAIGPT